MKVLMIICLVCSNLLALSQVASVPWQSSLDSVSQAARAELKKKAAQYYLLNAPRIEQEKKRKSDSLLAVFQRDMNISKEKADSLLLIINQSIQSMDGVAYNQAIPREEKIKRFKSLAAERDAKIAALLSESQLQQLHEIMRRGRSKPTR